jgi:hypothetical protein
MSPENHSESPVIPKQLFPRSPNRNTVLQIKNTVTRYALNVNPKSTENKATVGSILKYLGSFLKSKNNHKDSDMQYPANKDEVSRVLVWTEKTWEARRVGNTH